MEHFWIAFVNDHVELFGTKCQTRADAIDELKKAFLFDHNESKEAVPCNNYFIEEYFESQDLITIGKAEYFRMTIGKRGGVRSVKIMEK